MTLNLEIKILSVPIHLFNVWFHMRDESASEFMACLMSGFVNLLRCVLCLQMLCDCQIVLYFSNNWPVQARIHRLFSHFYGVVCLQSQSDLPYLPLIIQCALPTTLVLSWAGECLWGRGRVWEGKMAGFLGCGGSRWFRTWVHQSSWCRHEVTGCSSKVVMLGDFVSLMAECVLEWPNLC